MNILNTLINKITDLENGTISALNFAYDFPEYLGKHWDEIYSFDDELGTILNDDVLDWCSQLDVYDTKDKYTITEDCFRKNMHKVLELLININSIQKII